MKTRSGRTIEKKPTGRLNKPRGERTKVTRCKNPNAKRLLIDVNGGLSFIDAKDTLQAFGVERNNELERLQTISLEDGTFLQMFVECDNSIHEKQLIYNNAATTIAHDPAYKQNDSSISNRVRRWISGEGCDICAGRRDCPDPQVCVKAADVLIENLVHGNALFRRVDEDMDELGVTMEEFNEVWNTNYVKLRRTLDG